MQIVCQCEYTGPSSATKPLFNRTELLLLLTLLWKYFQCLICGTCGSCRFEP